TDSSKAVIDKDSFNGGDGTASLDDNGNIIWNEPATVVSFTIVDEAGNPVSGATVQIEDEEGNVIVGPWNSTSDGYAVAGVLKADSNKTYKLVEVESPNIYQKADPVEFKVEAKKVGPNENVVIEVSMAHKKNEVQTPDPQNEGTNNDPSNVNPTKPGSSEGEQKPQPVVNEGEQKPQPVVIDDEKKTQIDTNTAEQKKKEDRPATGDDFPVIPTAGLMLAAIAGMFVVGKKRKSR
ncbi:MAG: LPXTG cell wall anchor domain-containing protein, partial [Butyrivibrio sp.]|nr:LPXTG cell wall anchor domain-containing protein [Butyrivibrio sp.]